MMKIVICCPKCGNEDLEFLTPITSTVIRCCNDKCKEVFSINASGYNTKKMNS